MRVFRHTLTALVLSVAFTAVAFAGDKPEAALSKDVDNMVLNAASATKQSLMLDVSFDVMESSQMDEADNAALVADVAGKQVTRTIVDNNDA
ncbi:hypothetical protein [Alteromonas sp. CYL-A6]|uniref:hypothetical protein n=1 Tax=Alteromonas nitratireducens TaxID=3390813 RepID=UPI0034C2A908